MKWHSEDVILKTLFMFLGLAGAAGSMRAGPILYNFNFSGGTPNATGSFDYDTSTNLFSNVIVNWNGEQFLTALTAARGEGVIFWTGGSATHCCTGNRAHELSRESIQRQNVLGLALAETGDERLWIGARDTGLLSLQRGQLSNFSAKLPR